jgi:hypothetical protein
MGQTEAANKQSFNLGPGRMQMYAVITKIQMLEKPILNGSENQFGHLKNACLAFLIDKNILTIFQAEKH